MVAKPPLFEASSIPCPIFKCRADAPAIDIIAFDAVGAVDVGLGGDGSGVDASPTFGVVAASVDTSDAFDRVACGPFVCVADTSEGSDILASEEYMIRRTKAKRSTRASALVRVLTCSRCMSI